MVIALPARPSLALLGVRPDLLPNFTNTQRATGSGAQQQVYSNDCYLLPVVMSGTVDKPRVDFVGAARRLAALLLRQQAISHAAEHTTRSGSAGSGGGSGGFLALGKAVGEAMVKALVLPSREKIEEIEAQMAKDMSKVPQRWSSVGF